MSIAINPTQSNNSTYMMCFKSLTRWADKLKEVGTTMLNKNIVGSSDVLQAAANLRKACQTIENKMAQPAAGARKKK